MPTWQASQPSLALRTHLTGEPACVWPKLWANSTSGSGAKIGAPSRVLLDFDATDDPAHGEQEGAYYHGYYEEHILHPLLVFDLGTRASSSRHS
jgi:hypothetical protein